MAFRYCKGIFQTLQTRALANGKNVSNQLLARCYSQHVLGGAHNTNAPSVPFIVDKLYDKSAKIDPVTWTRYEVPCVNNFNITSVLGEPVETKPEILDPLETTIGIITDPDMGNKPEIHAHKRDKYWRRRGMKHHRYMRWRKRNETLLLQLEEKKAKKRELRRQEELDNIWKSAGLTKEPPVLSEAQRAEMIHNWREQGIWTEALTTEEFFTVITAPPPKNKKVLPPKKLPYK